MFEPTAYPPAYPHEPIEEIFSDIFLVHGSIRIGPAMRINRNMVVLRHNRTLTVVGAVRLGAGEQGALEKLGTIKHVVRIGYYHGIDDRYYVDRYGALFWCQRGSDRYPRPPVGRALGADINLPIPDASLFIFNETRYPEAAILIERHGGLLITGDSLQHWSDWSHCSLPAKTVMRLSGFSLRTLIGSFWLRHMTPRGGSLKADFERLLRLEFKHLVGAHGTVCRDRAREEVRAEVERVFH